MVPFSPSVTYHLHPYPYFCTMYGVTVVPLSPTMWQTYWCTICGWVFVTFVLWHLSIPSPCMPCMMIPQFLSLPLSFLLPFFYYLGLIWFSLPNLDPAVYSHEKSQSTREVGLLYWRGGIRPLNSNTKWLIVFTSPPHTEHVASVTLYPNLYILVLGVSALDHSVYFLPCGPITSVF